MSQIKYTKELLEPLVKQSTSMRQLILALGLQYTGGSNTHLKKVIKRLGLDFSHFKGQAWARDTKQGSKYPLNDYLSGKRFIASDRLKKRLIKEGYFEAKCYHCHNTKWLDKPIPLELHHKDSNHENNDLANLTILCPNCHAYIHSS